MLGLLLGVGLGLLMGLAWYSPDPLAPGVSAGPSLLKNNITRRDRGTGEPLIRDIIVYPPVDTPAGPVYRVTFEHFNRDVDPATNQPKRAWEARYTDAATPFETRRRQNLTLPEFLDQRAAGSDDITWQTAWWKEPRWHYAVSAAAGLLPGLFFGWPIASRLAAWEPTPRPVKKLRPKPIKPRPVAPEPESEPAATAEEKKYRGQFYPVIDDNEKKPT
jgi:hypothetical protein